MTLLCKGLRSWNENHALVMSVGEEMEYNVIEIVTSFFFLKGKPHGQKKVLVS